MLKSILLNLLVITAFTFSISNAEAGKRSDRIKKRAARVEKREAKQENRRDARHERRAKRRHARLAQKHHSQQHQSGALAKSICQHGYVQNKKGECIVRGVPAMVFATGNSVPVPVTVDPAPVAVSVPATCANGYHMTNGHSCEPDAPTPIVRAPGAAAARN